MTDNEIIKALECCTYHHGRCTSCPLYAEVTTVCREKKDNYALNLINRQKVEIEGLEETRYELACIIDELLMCMAEGKETKSAKPIDINEIKSEAIKEFAERLKEYAKELHIGDNISWLVLGVGRVDQLIKEMTEVAK